MPARPILTCCVWLIRLVGGLAPKWRRRELRAEWRAELEFATSRLEANRELTLGAQLRLLARCCSSIVLVVWMWKHEWSLEMFTRDVRYGIRMLRRRPMFATVAIATLAVGIGATTAVFSAVYGVLLKPLPYPAAGRLVKLASLDTRRDVPTVGNLSVPDVADFQRHSRSVDDLGAHNYGGYFTVTGPGEAERVARLLVTSGYFRVLGVSPAMGRLFATDEDRPSPPDVVVISDGYWKRRFGADPHIVGKTFTVSGSRATIVGVLPAAFVHPDPGIEMAPEIFALLDQDENVSGRGGRYVRGIAKLQPGVTNEQAESELQAIAASLATRHPDSNTGRSVRVQSLASAVAGDLRTPLLLLQGATAAILLIVCANLTNLLLATGTGRAGELAVRAALGAGRTRIVRQLVTESLVVAFLGGLGGTALGWWLTHALSQLASLSHVHRSAIAVDGVVLTFAFGVSMLAGLLFGLLPARYVARGSVSSALQETSRHTDSRGGRRVRAMLIVAEVALSVILLVGATLLLRSFWQLTSVDPGFDTRQILSFQLAVPPARYPSAAIPLFFETLYERLRALPGVREVGAVNILPMSGSYSCDGFQIVGRIVKTGDEACAEARSANRGYFDAMGIRLLRGRLFTDADLAKRPHVVIINETMAQQFFPGENAVGQRLIYSSRRQQDAREIVGIVASVRHFGLKRDPTPEFYVPQYQPPVYNNMTVVMRIDGDPLSLVGQVRSEVRALEPLAPIHNVRSMEQLVQRSVADTTLRTVLLALFAGVALFLAAIGTYGVTSVAVSHRRREMGIRLALGALRSDVVRMMMVQGLKPTLAGIVLGLAGAFAMAQGVADLLFDVRPVDPLTFVAVPLIIAATGVVATWLPARRACQVDPAAALRPE